MQQLVTTHSLELTRFDHLEASSADQPDYELVRVRTICPQLNRFLYASVGAEWTWYERLNWSYQRWLEFLDRNEVATWVAYQSGCPAGYFELEAQPGSSVEIVYFGLLPQFIGKGLGSALLRDAILQARESGAQRVWLHTCSLDHPSALANYMARGFEVFATREEYEEIPDSPLQPWPGAFTQNS